MAAFDWIAAAAEMAQTVAAKATRVASLVVVATPVVVSSLVWRVPSRLTHVTLVLGMTGP